MDRHDSKQAVINHVSVGKWEDGARAVKDAGGTVLQDKTTIPGQGYFAYCKDTEGNVFGIFEADPAAGQEPAAMGSGQQTA